MGKGLGFESGCRRIIALRRSDEVPPSSAFSRHETPGK